MTTYLKYSIGQIIHHRLFDYRGVIIDVDPVFQGSNDWYEEVARSRPPKDEPWYHVLVHDAGQRTYVAERNLEQDNTGQPVNHPDIEAHFERRENGRYVVRHIN